MNGIEYAAALAQAAADARVFLYRRAEAAREVKAVAAAAADAQTHLTEYYLETSEYIKIATVAQESGFGTVRHFYRLFQKEYNLSPADYRNAVKGMDEKEESKQADRRKKYLPLPIVNPFNNRMI